MGRVFFVALALVACAPVQQTQQAAQTEAPVASTSSSSSRLPAPTPSDVAVRIDATRNGQRVEVALNQRFAVELVGVPTAGYLWAPASVPAFLAPAGEFNGPTTREQTKPDFAGGNHWEVFAFTANAAGTGELVLEQRRPWETGEPPADSFRVTIVAR